MSEIGNLNHRRNLVLAAALAYQIAEKPVTGYSLADKSCNKESKLIDELRL